MSQCSSQLSSSSPNPPVSTVNKRNITTLKNSQENDFLGGSPYIREPSENLVNSDGLSDISSTEEESIKRKGLPYRDRCFRILIDSSYNGVAFIYMCINFASIFISTITFLVGTLPSYHGSNDITLNTVEDLVIIIFTFDYFAKIILTRKHRIKYALKFMNMLDLFAILPYYIELGLASDVSVNALVILRVLRLFRVLRILKMAKYSKQLPVVLNATKKSGAGFGLAFFSIGLFVVLWASAMYYAETSMCTFDSDDQYWKYDNGDITPFQSIPDSLWWAIVTMTTIGYGDYVPITAPGKLVAAGAMLCGILVLAFPLTILAGNFAEEYSTHLVLEEIKLKKKMIKDQHIEDNKTPKAILKNIWQEMLTLKGGLDNTKSTIDAFDRQFEKIELFVHKLERQLELDTSEILSKKMKKKRTTKG